MQTKTHHPLIVRMPNWVGDVLMALPSLDRLQAAGIECICVGRPWLPSLLAGLPYACVSLSGDRSADAVRIGNLPGRDTLLLTNSLGTTLQARQAGKRAFGFRGDGRSLLLHRSLPKPDVHEALRFWALAGMYLRHRRLFRPDDTPPPSVSLPLTARTRDEAAVLLQGHGIAPPFSVWCPLATGTIDGRSKCWPGFREACLIRSRAGETIVALPGPGEEEATADALPEAHHIHGTSLLVAAAICRQASGALSNDTGPMHLAAAAGCPVLGIFGNGNPHRTRPWGGHWIGDGTTWPSVEAVLARWRPIVDQRRPSGHGIGDQTAMSRTGGGEEAAGPTTP